SRLGAWLRDQGLPRGARLAVLTRPGVDFVTVIFGLFKAGLAPVLVDPGLGRARLLNCLAEGRPSGLVGVPLAHLASLTAPGLLKHLGLRVTVGRRFGWGGASLADILKAPERPGELPFPTRAEDLAAVLFTSGSTGPAKGVIYTHAMFAAQVEAIREGLDIRPGGRDLATFPLFGLFAPALGLTSIIPDFDPTRPAQADPRAVIEPILRHQVTSLFASPTLLTKAAAHAHERGLTLPSLERVISAGAPVPPRAVDSFQALLSGEAVLQTPYGATEGVPLSRIDAGEILSRTRALTEEGQGLCVGRPLPGVSLAVIRITDEPLAKFSPDLLLPEGEIGEIIARGPMVSPGYFERPEDTARSVIPDPDGQKFWRRMGDVGWLDPEGRLWFCGRKAHRVVTGSGVLFSIPCEAVFNNHPLVRRSALVGVGPPGDQKPVIIVELVSRLKGPAWPGLTAELAALARANPRTLAIETFLPHPAFPVDPRHNAKINREALAAWAGDALRQP
ncbi:MAG: AMP-binding protein, partial [Candidatus Adiutrix sp.]|nr:AMP-binding protein [Candidatus Adiutrix sp.]